MTSLIRWKKQQTFIDLLDEIPLGEHAAIYAGTSTYDAAAAAATAAAKAIAQGKGLRLDANGLLMFGSSVDLRGVKHIDIRANIKQSAGTLTIGGFSESGGMRVRLGDVTNADSPLTVAPPAQPVLKIFGASNSLFDLGACNYLQLYADASAGGIAAGGRMVAYNNFRITGTLGLLEITDSGTALSYVNENTIQGGRIIRYRVIGVGYKHNHNKLNDPTFEGGSVEITMNGGAHVNRIRGARFESISAAPGITFGEDTYSNSIECSWSGTGNPRSEFNNSIKISDLGYGNMVATEAAKTFRKTQLFSINGATPIAANAVDSTSTTTNINPAGFAGLGIKAVITPSLGGFEVGAGRLIALSDLIPVSRGDVVSYDCDFDGSKLRTVVYVYGVNMEPLTAEGGGGAFFSQPGMTFNAAGHYTQGADQPKTIYSGAVTRNEVAFIRVGFYSGAGGFFRGVSAALHTQALGRGVAEGAAADKATQRSIAGAPTKGLLPQGYRVWDSVNRRDCYVTYRHETSLTGALAAGATSATVASAGAIANADVCGILLDDGTTHWTAVSALAGATFNIDAIPVGRSAANGARVAFVRWEYSALVGSVVYNPPSLMDADGVTTTLTVTGAEMGDFVMASHGLDIAGLILTAWVSATDTVTVRWQNETGGVVDIGNSTLRVRVIKK